MYCLSDVPFAGEDKSKNKKIGVIRSYAQYSCRVFFSLYLLDLFVSCVLLQYEMNVSTATVLLVAVDQGNTHGLLHKRIIV